MFAGCKELTQIDLSSFETKNVTNMKYLFVDCTKLMTVILGEQFLTSQSTAIDNTFRKSITKSVFTGDVPASIHSNLFDNVGTNSNPATLEVPTEYYNSYAAKMDGNKFFGGYFTLSTYSSHIDDVSGSAEGEPFDVYTVSGQVVRRGVTSLKGLPAGIYIAGGRKVVVR